MVDTKEVEKGVEEGADQEIDPEIGKKTWTEEKADASSVERKDTRQPSVPTRMSIEGTTDMIVVVETILEITEDVDVIQGQAVTTLKQDTEEEEETAEMVDTGEEDQEEDEAEIEVTQETGGEDETEEVQREDRTLTIVDRTNIIKMGIDRERDNQDPNQGEMMGPLVQ